MDGLEALAGPAGADPGFVVRVFTAVNDGWVLGFGVAGGFLLLAALVAASLVRVSKEDAAKALKEGGVAA